MRNISSMTRSRYSKEVLWIGLHVVCMYVVYILSYISLIKRIIWIQKYPASFSWFVKDIKLYGIGIDKFDVELEFPKWNWLDVWIRVTNCQTWHRNKLLSIDPVVCLLTLFFDVHLLTCDDFTLPIISFQVFCIRLYCVSF